MKIPEGPYIQLLGNSAPKYHTIQGIMGPDSLMVVYVDPLKMMKFHPNASAEHKALSLHNGAGGIHRKHHAQNPRP